jgi:cytochrome P450
MNELWEDIKGVLRYISPGIWIIHPGIPRPVYKKSIHHIYAYFDQVIKERRSKGGEGEDLLSRLASDPGFSDDLIRDQMLTLFIAGHDTSTAALTWSLFLLASHPQVLARVKNEIEREAGKDIPCLAVVNRLDYLEMVIKESLRLYPPIHIGNRVAAKEILFQGYRIPEGTRVVYSIYLTHRHPGYWTRPDEFIPERFDNQLNPKPVPYSYLPFGGGPRNCIGMAFAMVELKLVLARIFQKFDLNFHSQRADQVVPYMGATLEPRPGVFLRISKSA